ncbi:YihY/virulence factor BrkB family protein [Marivita hallyeonensis]|uniref:Membrane protein n=1 Tax=Marivita hallyeonensis TaxID=996342 RepID=A0A1M5P020_9RHOB|nr:YihY/virulence factor BrkB family protein [Marivita hallyeonensis]SHG95140.1 membrane protein [Marivita hallyeonensis]
MFRNRARAGVSPLAAAGTIWRLWQKQSAMNLGLIAAGIAFYGLLSLFPGITAAVALAGVFIQPEMLVENSAQITGMLPDAAESIVMGQLQAVAGTDNSTLSFAAIFAVALALYSASRAVANFITGLNVIHAQTETRGFFAVKALTLLLTLLVIVGLILAIVLVAAIPVIAAIFRSSGYLDDLVLFLRWPVLFFMGVFGIALLYRLGPAGRYRKSRWLTPGALIACALWVAGSYGFSSYVQSFGSYNETFGALGGVIILLTWLWLSSFIVLIGALFDVEIEAVQDAKVAKIQAPNAE